jgi:hypothetical protein
MPRTKKRTVEELREMLRGVRWRDFVPETRPNLSKNLAMRTIIKINGIMAEARYGLFLGITGIGVVAEGQLLRFVPCVCPFRHLGSFKHRIDIMGKYDPPWDNFSPSDMLGFYDDMDNFNSAVFDPHNRNIKPIKASDYVIGK